jgi:hypothetical protein
MKAVKAGYEQFGTVFPMERVEVPSDSPDDDSYSGTSGSVVMYQPQYSSPNVAEAAHFGPHAVEAHEKWGHDPAAMASATAFAALGHAQEVHLQTGGRNADHTMFLHKKAIHSLNIPGADEAFVSRAAERMARQDPLLVNQRRQPGPLAP